MISTINAAPATNPSSLKTRLMAYCPNMSGGTIERAAKKTNVAIQAVARKQQERGYQIPLLVLFSENSLGYRFKVNSNEVETGLRQLQSGLPKDVVVAVAINCLEIRDGFYSNTGYLVTGGSFSFYQKFAFTNFESESLATSPSKAKNIGDAWKSLSEKRLAMHEEFPSFKLPCGMAIEYCICADVAQIKNSRPESVTAVSAHILGHQGLKFNHETRHSIIVNDSGAAYLSTFETLEQVYLSNVWNSYFSFAVEPPKTLLQIEPFAEPISIE